MKWVAILVDTEEQNPVLAIMQVYGPFKSESEAKDWSDCAYDGIPEDVREFRDFAIESMESA